MHSRIETPVLIVGGGPVGLTLALDLAWRGVDVTVAERRPAGEPPNVRCNQVSARSMEVFRRLGLAKVLREVGLPADYPCDVVSATAVTRIELSRVVIPSRSERYTATNGADSWWPTPEPPHRINQIYFEPILFAHAASQPRIRILNRTEIQGIVQNDHGVVASACSLDSGERLSIDCTYLVGCDGGKSTIRRAIGSRLAGTSEIQHVQSTFIYAPRLIDLLPGKRAWMYLSLNPRRCGATIAVDGREHWLVHNFLYHGETEFESIDRDWAIREILGVGEDFDYQVISKQDWVGRRLVADKFRCGRVFICGDAAHLWMPNSGYGMNAGIADAADLSWMISGVLGGWAAPAILDAYEAERQPITDQVSRFTTDIALKIMQQRREVPEEIEQPGPDGDALRAQFGKTAFAIDVQQQCAGGLNFGYFYENSPIIAYDGDPHPGYTMHDFRHSTVPGCRAPHLWLGNGRSLYDVLGSDYTLLRFDPSARIEGISRTAAQRGFPLTALDIEARDARAIYGHALVLVRPDQHVAWRGHKEPAAPEVLIDIVSGARAATPRTGA
jgi:2-polyprenyl-6-methoxyphenol hydroxylase-like FAD-dependent oxidoreductase